MQDTLETTLVTSNTLENLPLPSRSPWDRIPGLLHESSYKVEAHVLIAQGQPVGFALLKHSLDVDTWRDEGITLLFGEIDFLYVDERLRNQRLSYHLLEPVASSLCKIIDQACKAASSTGQEVRVDFNRTNIEHAGGERFLSRLGSMVPALTKLRFDAAEFC